MKPFFKYVFATIVGILILTIVSMILFGSILGIAIKNSTKKDTVSIDANSVLKLELTMPVNDRPTEEDFLAEFSNEINSNSGLYPTIQAIKHAKEDKEIRGLFLQVDIVPTGLANLQDLYDALTDFKSSGKFVVSNSRTLTQKGYAIASIADEVYMHPEGYIEFKGFGTQITFIKGMLDKIGVEPMIFYAGKFKSATEPLRRTNMSEENKLQTKEFVEDLYGNYLEMISVNRDISSQELRAIADDMKVQSPKDAVEYGLIDGVKYDDEVHSILKEKIGFAEDKDLSFVSLSEYIKARKIDVNGKHLGNNRIAVIYAEGGINMGDKDNNNIQGDYYANIIRKIRKNDKIKAVVLRVNSGGGSAFASDIIWRELELLKKEKPIVVSMGNYAASGGYYIACNANKIFAQENTITGSIGVFGVLFNTQKMLENKLGITTDGIGTGKYSDFPNMSKQWSETEKQFIQSYVDNTYQNFISKVASGRNMSVEDVHEIAQGRVWSGQDALEIGLVDEIGSLQDAIDYAKKEAAIDEYKISIYPKNKTAFERLMESFNLEARAEAKLKEKLGIFSETYELIESIEELEGVQMKIPFEIEVE